MDTDSLWLALVVLFVAICLMVGIFVKAPWAHTGTNVSPAAQTSIVVRH